MVSSPHLTTTLIYDVSQRLSQYLSRCVTASVSEVVEVMGVVVPFSLEPILVNLEVGRYIGPILPVSLVELVGGRRSASGSAPKSGGSGRNGGGGGGNKKHLPKVDATGGLHNCGHGITRTCPPCLFGIAVTCVTF